MAGYRLYTGGPYKQRNGSAITATSTQIDSGVAKYIPGDSNLVRVANLSGPPGFPTVVGGVDGYGVADVVASLQVDTVGQTSVAEDLVYFEYVSPHGLRVGDIIMVTSDPTSVFLQTYYRVLRVDSANKVTINMEHFSALNSRQPTTAIVNGTYATQAADNYIMMKNDGMVHGKANSKLESGASDRRRPKIAKFDITFTTARVAAAIKAGKYNFYSGSFSASFPVVAVDTYNADEETTDSVSKIGLKGEVTLRNGGANPASFDYDSKTN